MPEAWREGWWTAAEAIASPNHGPRPAHTAIDLVVVHSISLPPGEYGSDAIERLFTNRLGWDDHPYFQSIRGLEVSSHFVVRRNGHVQQFVSTLVRAWHAGRSNWRGRENCNDFSIGIELEGLEGDPFEGTQYASLVRLCNALVQQHPLAHVAGHEHIAPGRKSDPGAGFDWAHLQRALGWARACFPEGTTRPCNDVPGTSI